MKDNFDFIPCDSARLQSSAWIDGELLASSALLSHLERCGECRLHVEELRALSARLAPLRAGEPLVDLWPAIAARAREHARPANRWSLSARRIAAALIGCAGTTGLLEAAAHLGRASHVEKAVSQSAWPAALHQEPTAVRELRSAPEQRLLASIDPAPKDREERR